MERKRSYLEVAYDILYTTRYGARPTAIVYQANLNFNIIKKYLLEMQEADLIKVENSNKTKTGTRTYYTTERGYEFMESLLKTRNLYHKATDWPILQTPKEIGTLGIT